MVALVEAAGARSLLCIPMLKEENVIGAIAIYHQERRPFDEERIAVVKNFASRAVIAVESARGLKALWLELFAGARSIKLSADQILFSAGQEGDGCYRVDEGLLKASVTDPEGDEWILNTLPQACEKFPHRGAVGCRYNPPQLNTGPRNERKFLRLVRSGDGGRHLGSG
jgi:hypothetical protein